MRAHRRRVANTVERWRRRTAVGGNVYAGGVVENDVDAGSVGGRVDDLVPGEVVDGAVARRLQAARRRLRLVLLQSNWRPTQHQPALVPHLHTTHTLSLIHISEPTRPY